MKAIPGSVIRLTMAKGKQIFAFFGTDEALVKDAALRLARELTPAANPDFGLEVVSGTAETSDHAAAIVRDTIAGIQTLPFFGGDKIVWLQGINFLADTVTGRAAATLEAVETLGKQLEAGLPSGVSLILSGSEIDKRRAFAKLLGKVATLEILDLPDPSSKNWQQEVQTIVRDRAKSVGFRFEPEALEAFVLFTGESTYQLHSEVEKLALYIAPRKAATLEDVEAVTARTRAGVIFEISDALAARNLPRTLELIDQQLRKGESAIAILLAAIVPRVRNLLLARDLAEQHSLPSRAYPSFETALNRLPQSATAHLPRKKDGGISAYPIYLALEPSRRFSLQELRDGFQDCLVANRRLVTTQMDPRTVLFQLVTRLLHQV